MSGESGVVVRECPDACGGCATAHVLDAVVYTRVRTSDCPAVDNADAEIDCNIWNFGKRCLRLMRQLR